MKNLIPTTLAKLLFFTIFAFAISTVNAQNVSLNEVTKVRYSKGEFVQQKNGLWAENGTKIFSETGRKDNVIYTFKEDTKEGVNFDLTRMKIVYSHNGSSFDLYTITNVSGDPKNQESSNITFLNEETTQVKYTKSNSQGEVIKTGIINGGQRATLPCNLRDHYTFVLVMADARMGRVIPDLTVTNCGIEHEIIRDKADIDPRFLFKGDYTASNFSYDILHIDPIFITTLKTEQVPAAYGKNTMSKGGRCKQVFKSLDANSKNMKIDGLPEHFTKTSVDFGFAKKLSSMVYSAKSFAQAFSGNIEAGGGVKGIKGKNSAAFEYATKEEKANRKVFVFSRENAVKYNISLEKENSIFDDRFIQAIKDLPTSSSSGYDNFIKNWGTHYPKKIEYGGVKVFVSAMEFDKMGASESWGIDVKQQAEVEAKAISAETAREFGYKTSNDWNNLTKDDESFGFYKGGEGTVKNWEVTDNSVQPVSINLERLHELLVFNLWQSEGITERELSTKKRLLGEAIAKYLGSAEDIGTPIKPKKYKLSKVSWKLTKGENGGNKADVFGVINAMFVQNDKASWHETIYNKLESEKVTATINQQQNCDYKGFKETIVTTHPEANGSNSGGYFEITGTLIHWHWGWVEQAGLIGSGPINNTTKREWHIFTDEISTAPKKLDYKYESKYGTIELSATVEEVDYPFDL